MEESKTIKSDDNPSGNPGMTVEEWLNGEQLSVDIWYGKYQQGDETFEQWLDRVSGGNQHIRQLIKEQKFIFAGRILSNRGVTDRKITYSNCYCLTPPQDSLESIFEAGSKLARTFSYGGGSGVDVSNLRPKNAPVNNAAKSTSGTVSFMDFYSYITGLIGQEGRRGALMISISCEHPDLVEFINLKADLDICTKANISVRVTNAFMRAVESNSDFKLHFTMEDGSEITRIVNAREVFMLLAKRNWEMAEPGILYWDRISDYNLLQGTGFKYAGVNPCAEEPLPAGGSCLLGSINLSKFVEYPFTDYPIVKYDELAKTVESAICALNDVLIEGLPLHPLQEQRDSVAGWRQIGLGTMGLGDLLLMCGKKYGAPESIPVITKIYHLIASTAVKTSLQLAKDNECFPNCTPEIKKAMVECDFIRNLDLPKEVLDDIKEYGLFNSQLLTCAPTGSIGTMLQVSTGVEPNYAFSYNRRTVSLNKEETVYKVDTKIVADYKKATGNDTLPDYFVSSEQIPYEQRIEVQATLQRFIDASISSTVNLPNSITIEDVANLYLLAWKKGLKGITIWRDGCQRQAILTKENSGSEEQPVLKRGEILKASDDLVGKKRTLQTGCGTLHLSAWFDKNTGELVETFFSKGSTGGCALFMTGLSRMTSLAARAGAPIDAIVDQLLSSGTCPSYAVRNATKKDTSKGSSCPVAIGYALMEMYKDVQSQIEVNKTLHGHWAYNRTDEVTQEREGHIESPKCPKCGEPIQMVEGCMTCPSCGYSKCS